MKIEREREKREKVGFWWKTKRVKEIISFGKKILIDRDGKKS